MEAGLLANVAEEVRTVRWATALLRQNAAPKSQSAGSLCCTYHAPNKAKLSVLAPLIASDDGDPAVAFRTASHTGARRRAR